MLVVRAQSPSPLYGHHRLPLRLPVPLPLRLPVRVPVRLPVRVPVRVAVRLAVRLPVRLPVRLRLAWLECLADVSSTPFPLCQVFSVA